MKLSDLLFVLRVNKNLIITLNDGGKAVETFSAIKYEFADDMYGDRTVASAKLTSPSTMTINLDCDYDDLGDDEVEETDSE